MTRREKLYVAWLPAGTSGTAACWHATWSNPIAVTIDVGEGFNSRKGGLCMYKRVKIVSIQYLVVLGVGLEAGVE